MKALSYSFVGILFTLLIFSCNSEKEKEINPLKNQLSTASSPYLLGHSDNPVDWYEWSPEVLEKAKKKINL